MALIIFRESIKLYLKNQRNTKIIINESTSVHHQQLGPESLQQV
jgi:hypothetical protein